MRGGHRDFFTCTLLLVRENEGGRVTITSEQDGKVEWLYQITRWWWGRFRVLGF